MDLTTMSNDELAAALTDTREKASALFSLEAPTVDQVNEAEALVASISGIEAEQANRAEIVKDAEARFAAARATFSGEGDGGDAGDAADGDAEGDAEPEAEAEGDAEVEASATTPADEENPEDEMKEPEMAAEPTVAASGAQRINPSKPSAAKRVGARTTRPKVADAKPVTITASADVPGFATGASLDGMDEVAQALMNRARGFAPFNERAAKQVNTQSGGEPVLQKFSVASLGLNFPEALVADGKGSNDYAAVKAAFKSSEDRFSDDVITAAGWCAPSENVYSFLAGYVIDGLVTVPEVSAPRGGLNMTTGPARGAVDDHGWIQTEAQAIAETTKPLETIVCPTFTDYRLDAIGYGWTIPFLTEKAYPELVADALRFSAVLYAHKVNKKVITDIETLSTANTIDALGAAFTDALEALSVIAVRERRKWHVGVNTVMEVKLPEYAKEVFRSDISRRTAVAVDAVTDEQINAHFTARKLAVEYVADWQDLSGTNSTLPANFKAIVYPAGTFIKAVEDVVNLSAVYDAANLVKNNYTGVFFEQGLKVIRAGFGSSVITVPNANAGRSGAASLVVT
jgi:hypothetical protein